MSTEQDSVRRLTEADAHALRALAEAWAEEHDLPDSVGAFEAGWEARQPIIDSLTAERDETLALNITLAGDIAVWAAEVKRLREVLGNAHEILNELPLPSYEPLAAAFDAVVSEIAALATPPSEGGA